MKNIVKEYFSGNDFAYTVWKDKYALKDEGGNLIEKNPDETVRRVAREFAKVDAELSPASPLTEDEIYHYFKDFKYIVPGGSVLSGCGSKSPISLSNCFVIDSPEDSYDSIMNTRNKQVQLMKRRGGVGLDLSKLRPRGAKVNNAAITSTGAASFMDGFSAITNEVAQNGRRGALMLTMNIQHPDIEEFISKKQDLTKVTGANISVKVTDAFMKAVENDEDFYLRFPIDLDINGKNIECEYGVLTEVGKKEYIKKVKAKKLWESIVHCAWNTAEPGIIFDDRMHNYAPDSCYDDFRMISTNPCGEIGMSGGDSCRLIAINLASFVENPFTPNAKFDYANLFDVAKVAQRLGDDLVEMEIKAVGRILDTIKDDETTERKVWERAVDVGKRGRRTGTGFLGLADAIAMLGLKYDSDEGIKVIEKICKTLFEGELDSSVQLATVRGTFKEFDAKKESDAAENGNKMFAFIKNEYKSLWSDMQAFGRRNISWSTVAPTGTISNLAQTTSGVEPLFFPYYERKKKCMKDTDRVDYVDKVGEKFTVYVMVHKGLKDWAHIAKGISYDEMDDFNVERWKELYEESPYYGSIAPDIDSHKRVEIQSLIQKYISHSISSTCNLDKEITEDEVSNIYFDAWKGGCKGITIYRDGCRENVISAIGKKKEEEKFFSSDIRAPKRPKTLEGDFYTTKIKGEVFYVIVGLYEERPYEIFVYNASKSLENPKTIEYHKGAITKVAKNKYNFVSDIITIQDISSDLTTEELSTALYSSMLLRHGAGLKYIIKTARKVDDNILSFTAAMTRILSKYLPKETLDEVCPECGGKLVREGGCIHCVDCSWSRCN